MAGYKTGGAISGEILIDGKKKDPSTWKKISGYAEQQDILNPYLSVMETLRLTAKCRLPRGHEREEVIQQVINLMGIEDWADHIIGREKDGEGLPKHVRKRVTIANELVALPRVRSCAIVIVNFFVAVYQLCTFLLHISSIGKILFLDEPTTGLGTNEAALVMNAVRQATDAMGLITVATIH